MFAESHAYPATICLANVDNPEVFIEGVDSTLVPNVAGFLSFANTTSWDSSAYITSIEVTHSIVAPHELMRAKGPQIVEVPPRPTFQNR